MRTKPLSLDAQARIEEALAKTDWYAIPNRHERTTRYRARREELEAEGAGARRR